MVDERPNLLEVKDLKKYFPITSGLLKRTTGYVKAVDGVNFFIKEGETLWRRRGRMRSSRLWTC